MPVSAIAVFAVILAVGLAAGLSAFAARAFRRSAAAPWWGALAVGLGYIIGHVGVATPSIPPADVTDRIPLIAFAGAVVAAAFAGNRDGRRARVAGYLGLAVLVYTVMLSPVLGSGEYPDDTVVWLAATGVGCLLALLNIGLLDTPARRSELWAALAVYAAGAGVVLLLSNSAVLFQLGGVLALVLAASLLGARGFPLGGGVPVAAGVLTALVVEGFVYAFLPAWSAVMLAAAPAVLWLNRFSPLARLGPRARAAVAAGLIFVPIAVAVAIVMFSKSSDGY